jgi:hypothetical protein
MSAGARKGTSWRARSARDGLVLSAAMVLSGALDYFTNVVAGRGLAPVEFGVFVTVMAVVQVLTLLSIALRMVVAFYTAELTAQPDAVALGGAFLRVAARWSLRWGLIATAVAAAASRSSRPRCASGRLATLGGDAVVLMLFLRETAFGTLQGFQASRRARGVQVVQAWSAWPPPSRSSRWRARPAPRSLRSRSRRSLASPSPPGGCARTSARARRRARVEQRVSWRYSVSTLVGLAVFGLLTNADALFVRRYFSPEVAGHYGPVVTLAKISLFLPWAIGLVLFPKVARRRAAGRESRSLLVLALGAALAPGLAVTAIYFLAPGWLVRTVFTGAYADPGAVLGLASLAATFYAGIHIWLNYALSLERRATCTCCSPSWRRRGSGCTSSAGTGSCR